MNFVRSTSTMLVGRLTTVALGLVGLTVFARIVPSSELGAFFLFQSMLGVLTIPADLGVRNAVTKRVSEATERNRYFTAGLLLKTGFLGVLSAVIYSQQAPVNDYLGADLALPLLAGIILQEYGLYFMAGLRGELRVGETAIWELLKTVGWTVGGGALVVLGVYSGAVALVVGLLSGLAAMVVVGLVRTSLRLRRPSVAHVRSILEFGVFAATGSVGALVYNWADVLILGLFVSRSEVAAYEIAWRVAMNLTIVSAAIRVVLFSQASHWYANDEVEKIERILPVLLTVSLAVSVPAVVGGALLRTEVLTLVFSPEYAIASAAFVVLLVNMVDSNVAQIAGGGLLYAVDRPDLSLRATATATGLNVVLNFALIPTYGIVGAAVATTLASIVGTAMNLWFLRAFVTIRIQWSNLGWIAVTAIAMGGFVYLLRTVYPVSNLPRLLAVILLAAATYFALLLTAPSFRRLATDVVGRMRSAGEFSG